MSVKDPNPLNRPPVWSMSSTNSTVDARTYYKNSGSASNRYRVLTQIENTAGEPIPGLKKRQAELTLTVKINQSESPFNVGIVNKTNEVSWGGGAPQTWLISSMAATQKTEFVESTPVDYWEVTYSLIYREETWKVKTPNVGLMAKSEDGTGRERVMVFDQDGNRTPAPRPLPLDADGFAKDLGADADVLEFQIYEPTDFSVIFGDPPS
jgi:hypothetical protein